MPGNVTIDPIDPSVAGVVGFPAAPDARYRPDLRHSARAATGGFRPLPVAPGGGRCGPTGVRPSGRCRAGDVEELDVSGR
nr:hypothetical protein KPHV_61410 [Kitasatospora purpeofusca]